MPPVWPDSDNRFIVVLYSDAVSEIILLTASISWMSLQATAGEICGFMGSVLKTAYNFYINSLDHLQLVLKHVAI